MPRIVKNIPLMDLMSYLIESADSPTHVGVLQMFEPVYGSCSEAAQRVQKGFRDSEAPSLAQLVSQAGKGVGAQVRAMRDVARALGRSALQAGGLLDRVSPLPFSAPKSLFNKPV